VVVEEEVEKELLFTDLQRLLAAVEREPGAQLDQELLDVVDQRLLQLALAGLLSKLKEVEDVWILGCLESLLDVAGSSATSKLSAAPARS
jgi:hypothetical protein